MSAAPKIEALEGTKQNWARWNMVNQANELIVAHLNTATGEAIYKAMEAQWPFVEQRASGVIPINHVLRYRTTNQTLKVGTTLEMKTRVRLVAERQPDGNFRRVHMHGLCDVFAGRETPAGTAEYWVALTKPFAPAGQRRLTEIPEKLQPLVMHDYPEDAAPLQDVAGFMLPGAPHTSVQQELFHINQTDMNRHVNTIVYLDLAQDRIATLADQCGLDVAAMRFRDLEVFYRKPFAAGDRYQLELDLAQAGPGFETAVRFIPLREGKPEDKIAVGLRIRGEFVG